MCICHKFEKEKNNQIDLDDLKWCWCMMCMLLHPYDLNLFFDSSTTIPAIQTCVARITTRPRVPSSCWSTVEQNSGRRISDHCENTNESLWNNKRNKTRWMKKPNSIQNRIGFLRRLVFYLHFANFSIHRAVYKWILMSYHRLTESLYTNFCREKVFYVTWLHQIESISVFFLH